MLGLSGNNPVENNLVERTPYKCSWADIQSHNNENWQHDSTDFAHMWPSCLGQLSLRIDSILAGNSIFTVLTSVTVTTCTNIKIQSNSFIIQVL